MNEAIQKACKELPEGWRIEINLEQGSGWLDLYNPDGEKVSDQLDLADLDLHEQVFVCIKFAKE